MQNYTEPSFLAHKKPGSSLCFCRCYAFLSVLSISIAGNYLAVCPTLCGVLCIRLRFLSVTWGILQFSCIQKNVPIYLYVITKISRIRGPSISVCRIFSLHLTNVWWSSRSHFSGTSHVLSFIARDLVSVYNALLWLPQRSYLRIGTSKIRSLLTRNKSKQDTLVVATQKCFAILLMDVNAFVSIASRQDHGYAFISPTGASHGWFSSNVSEASPCRGCFKRCQSRTSKTLHVLHC